MVSGIRMASRPAITVSTANIMYGVLGNMSCCKQTDNGIAMTVTERY